jgi:hypothetical protein
MNHYNHQTRITAATLGVFLGLAGSINHGIFEIMQGNTPTEGLFIEAIGKAHRFWTYGTEGAITVIPNFLLTGIAVLLVSLAVIVWSLKFFHTRAYRAFSAYLGFCDADRQTVIMVEEGLVDGRAERPGRIVEADAGTDGHLVDHGHGTRDIRLFPMANGSGCANEYHVWFCSADRSACQYYIYLRFCT